MRPESTVVEFTTKTEFWPGFILVLERSELDTRWEHLGRILDLGNVQFLVRLGFLGSSENCSKLVDYFLSETEKSESRPKINLEQISTKMVEAIGAGETMKILTEKSSNFRTVFFSKK